MSSHLSPPSSVSPSSLRVSLNPGGSSPFVSSSLSSPFGNHTWAAHGPLSTGGASSSRSSVLRRKTRTIVVLGFTHVGKTALCVRFVNDRFSEAYEPTYENSFHKIFNHHGKEIECVIKDTQGVADQEHFRPDLTLGVHAYVLVYSIASLRSFEALRMINAKLINLVGTSNVPRILVGSKADLETAELRQVSAEMGAAQAEKWGCAFTECSSKSGINVDRAFATLLDEIDRQSEPERDTFASGLIRAVASTDFLGCCRRSSSADHSSPLSPPSPLDIAAAINQWTLRAKVGAWTTMVLSLLAIAFAVWLGVHDGGSSGEDTQGELLCYILVSFGVLVWLTSMVQLWSMRSSSSELLKVCSISSMILVVSELATLILLGTSMDAVSDHSLAIGLVATPTLLIQLAAAVAGLKLGQALGESTSAGAYAGGSEPYLPGGASYHGLLYE